MELSVRRAVANLPRPRLVGEHRFERRGCGVVPDAGVEVEQVNGPATPRHLPASGLSGEGQHRLAGLFVDRKGRCDLALGLG